MGARVKKADSRQQAKAEKKHEYIMRTENFRFI